MADVQLDGVTSDPVAMGWMVGAPPPLDKRILAARADHMRFPMIRWSYSNMRSFAATANVAASGTGTPFPRNLRPDLAALRFTPLGAGEDMTFEQSLIRNYTDGILVLHRGEVVFERWFGVTGPLTRHIAFSVTKSFVGTLLEMLVGEGRIDLSARVDSVIPELASSGFGNATIGQVHAMTTALDYSEDYTDPNSGVGAYSNALGLTPRPAGYTGPNNLWDYLATVPGAGSKGAVGNHGERFVYRTPNTDVLAWIISRAEGKPLHQVLSQRLWQPLGMLGDADLMVDEAGSPFAGGGLNLRLEDLARFGEALRLDGAGVIPEADVARIRSGGYPARFDPVTYPHLPGWSYGSQWWHSHDNHGAFNARGIHGQTLWIDPVAEMVISRFGSHRIASSIANDPHSVPVWRALADALSS
ncbi:serine hydrolase [Novosphingobium sp. Chol11]|uniref:serine hydrolase domain-containing protein n=1 Tax=Novosphingobium sp. Chol11 TaxID=1385763 RepID=UPI0025E331A8|nr:serine hydrolase [Novosphingobium sp. Chol11]